MILEGIPPKKHQLGKGTCGVDEGTSCVAFVNHNYADFVVLADGVETYEKEIKKAAASYFRKLRLNNPECFDKEGRMIKGSRFKNYSKAMKKAILVLKNAYRKKTIFIKQSHNRLVNALLSSCDTVVKEPMNFRALAKRAKQTSRKDKALAIRQKNGQTKEIYPYKKKKRFGKSIGRLVFEFFILNIPISKRF